MKIGNSSTHYENGKTKVRSYIKDYLLKNGFSESNLIFLFFFF
jgi:hypothetical protein